jgi:hypothetical protein
VSWTTISLSGKAGADSNANLKLRFGATGSSSADYCWFDSLDVQGTAISGSSPTASPAAPPGPTGPSPLTSPPSSPVGCPTCLGATNYDPLNGSGAVIRNALSSPTMWTGAGASTNVLDWQHMIVPSDADTPIHSFEGTLTLPDAAPTETANFEKIKDQFN